MNWVVRADKDIVGNRRQLNARRLYISEVTSSQVSDWEEFSVLPNHFLRCTSLEGVDGVVITAHTNDILPLSTLEWIIKKPLLVANTCVGKVGNDKILLSLLQRVNPEIELRFAKQKASFEGKFFFQYADLEYVGAFGFKTSWSDRDLFRYCSKVGFRPALEKAFHQVCPTSCSASEEV